MLEMQPTKNLGGAGRKRVEAVVETLSNLRGRGESLAEVAHDARNMVTALGLYCELLEEPGVLTPSFSHYSSELNLVATACRRLVEKLVALDSRQAQEGFASSAAKSELRDKSGHALNAALESPSSKSVTTEPVEPSQYWDMAPTGPIANLSAELLANRNLLAALAGPAITLTMDAEGCALPVWLTTEDLTRVLVNLVKNAAEAMPAGGRIQLNLRKREASTETKPSMLLTIEDNGPGIPPEALENIFDTGYTTRTGEDKKPYDWPATHRGLGLSITRSIIEAASGRIYATNRSQSGARFEIELPVNNR